MHSPKLSIIIPVYNAEKYIACCVQSLFEQTLDDIEYIFVDDCSTDGSLHLLRELVAAYENRSANIKIVRHEVNRGSATARNTGLLHATGEYIGWVDSDDWVELVMFEELYSYAKKEDLDLVWCDFYVTFKSNEILIRQDNENNKYDFINNILDGKHDGMLWNKVVKRSLFIDNNIYFQDGCDISEDRNVCIKLLYFSNKIKHLAHALYHYTQYNSISITRDDNSNRIYQEINNTRDLLLFFDSYGLDCISLNALNKLKLRSKRKLLFSMDIKDLIQWSMIFPECNYMVYSDHRIFIHHKLIAWLCMKHVWLPLKVILQMRSLYRYGKQILKKK